MAIFVPESISNSSHRARLENVSHFPKKSKFNQGHDCFRAPGAARTPPVRQLPVTFPFVPRVSRSFTRFFRGLTRRLVQVLAIIIKIFGLIKTVSLS